MVRFVHGSDGCAGRQSGPGTWLMRRQPTVPARSAASRDSDVRMGGSRLAGDALRDVRRRDPDLTSGVLALGVWGLEFDSYFAPPC